MPLFLPLGHKLQQSLMLVLLRINRLPKPRPHNPQRPITPINHLIEQLL